MKDILLKDLLEAGCHFGHKVSRWHPKAASFIYQERDGVHIIDLGKTRDGLRQAGEFVKELAKLGKILLLVATKRQARGVVTEVGKNTGIHYMTNRWLGGFVTNWEVVKKNIDKVNRMRAEKTDGSWQKFPKHEQVQLAKELRKLEMVYSGVTSLTNLPDAVFIVDIKKEVACLKEAARKSIKTVAIVDTNTDPTLVDYPIPANDDAIGSIQYIANYIAEAYLEGKKLGEKKEEKEISKEKKEVGEKQEEVEKVGKKPRPKADKPLAEKQRGRPKKIVNSKL